VDSVRGPGGGYCLAKKIDEVSIADIILAVDEPIDATQCGGKENCHDDHKCITHDLWASLNDRIFDYLQSVKLSQLVVSQKTGNVAVMRDQRKHKKSEPVIPA
ncbi:MAG: Rrf2 family transcriptional regulator, partial [Burkholderiales bacterium]